jgi:hypothetical protein
MPAVKPKNSRELQPTHRHKDQGGWEKFNEVLGKWEPIEAVVLKGVNLIELQEHNDYRYYADQINQPVRVYTLESVKLTNTEKKVLARYGQDIQLHMQLLKGIDPGLPLVEQLRIAGDNVRMVLESGYWLKEIE